MIQEHKFNFKLSKETYENNKNRIEKNLCYNNVFNLITWDDEDKFRGEKWKVAYGYVTLPSESSIMVRHCFVINEENEVIDPTLVCTNYEDLDKIKGNKYITFAILELDNYLDMLWKYDRMPELTEPLFEKDKLASEWAMENGVMLIG